MIRRSTGPAATARPSRCSRRGRDEPGPAQDPQGGHRRQGGEPRRGLRRPRAGRMAAPPQPRGGARPGDAARPRLDREGVPPRRAVRPRGGARRRRHPPLGRPDGRSRSAHPRRQPGEPGLPHRDQPRRALPRARPGAGRALPGRGAVALRRRAAAKRQRRPALPGAQRRGDHQERPRPHHRADALHRRLPDRPLPRRRPDHLDADRLDGVQPVGRRTDPLPAPAGRGADADLSARPVAAADRGAGQRQHRGDAGDPARGGLPDPRRPGGDLARLSRRGAARPQRLAGAPGEDQRARLLRQPAGQAPLGRPGRDRRREPPRRLAGGWGGMSAPVRRRPGRLRRWVVRPFVWGLVLVAVLIAALLLFLQSGYARRQLAARLVAAVSEKIGRPVLVGDVDYTFFPLALELHDVVIPGPGPADPAVARIPLARVQATWRDLEKRVVRLDQVEAVHPQIYIRIDPDGSTNLPRWRTERQGPRRFEVQIGRILVQDGTFQLNERRTPLRIDARAVWGRVIGRAERGGEGGERLDAMVTAQDVVTRLPNANPWPATISAKGTIFASEGRLRITNARFAGPDLQAQVEGAVEWREKKRVALNGDAHGETPLLNRLGYLQEPIAGPFAFKGQIRVQGPQVFYGGVITSPRLSILHRELRDIEADLSGGRERLEVDVRRAGYAGGRIEGPVSVPFQDEGRPGTPVELDLVLTGLGLQPLIRDQFPGQDIPVVSGLAGRVRGTLTYDFDSREPLSGSGFADLSVEAVQQAGGLPLSGDLPITIEEGVLSSDDLHVTAPEQDLRIDGFQFSLPRVAGRLAYHLESRDLGRLAPLLLEDLKPGEERPFWVPTAGQGTLAGEVTIDRTDYVAQVQLDLRNAVTPDLTAQAVRGSLRLRPGAVEDLQLALSEEPGTLTVS